MKTSLSILCAALLVGGCVSLAPDGIKGARIDFNRDVHETNDEQLLLNIVRVHKFESPVFSNVVERDFQATSSGGISGGATSIGAIPALGMLSGTITVTQAPTDKILIPYGIDLINQYDSPITLASFNNLYQANWSLAAVLQFVFQNLTPDYSDYVKAQDLIRALDSFGALGFASYGDNSLVIYLRKPKAKTSDELGADTCFVSQTPTDDVQHYWKELTSIYNISKNRDRIILQLPEKDVIKGVATHADKTPNSVEYLYHTDLSHLISTRSALGALKEAQENDEFYFLETEDATKFFEDNEKASSKYFDTSVKGGFYYVPNAMTYSHLRAISGGSAISQTTAIDYLWSQDCSNMKRNSVSTRISQSSGGRRALLVIEEGVQPDPLAYVSTYYRGRFYSIRDTDNITKNNFALLSTILTIEARPSANAPTPTVLTPSVR